MIKVTGIGALAEIIEGNNRIEKAERQIRKDKVNELISQGIEKEVAKAMVQAYWDCGIR